MAPSVELYSRENSDLNLDSKDKLIYSNSNLNKNEEKSVITDGKEEKVKIYRADRSFSTRKEEAEAIRNKFPTKVPIIVDRFHKECSLPRLERSKFLVPQEITMSQFVTIIRNRMKLGSNQAFYLLINNRSMLSLSRTLAEVYKDHKERDGFLYVTYASQEVFG